MINIAIIGYGYWGPNLVRNFASTAHCKVYAVADSRTERLDHVKQFYPSVHTTQHTADIFNDAAIDAVVIATPVFTHFSLAKQALQCWKTCVTGETNDSYCCRI
jgi:predicted dehydrogenase